MIVTQKMFGYCGRLRAVSLFVNRSAMFVEAVFKSTFGFSYVLFYILPKEHKQGNMASRLAINPRTL